MIIRTVLDLQGVTRGGTAFEDDLFLLTGNGRVLAARSELTEPLPGRNFFDTFRAKDSEKHELFRLMNEFGDAPAFFVAQAKPCCFSPRTMPKPAFSQRWCRGIPLLFSRILPAR